MKFQLAFVATLVAVASAVPAGDKVDVLARQDESCCVRYPGAKSVCERECLNANMCKAYGIPTTGWYCSCGGGYGC